MNDKVLERFSSNRKYEAAMPPAAEDAADPHDLGFFGVLRGTSERAVMLELRQRTGNIMAIGYSWLERIEFDPSHGIKLFAAGWEITISGQNLNEEVRPNLRLFEAITRHRVPWIREADEDEAMQSPEQATVIDGIGWKGFKR